MKTRVVIGIIGALCLGVLGTAYFTLPQPSAEQTQTTQQVSSAASSNQTSTASTTGAGYTLADVAQHNNASNCWSAINGNVYDLTNWIYQHPGGPEHILAICGTDGSAAFNAQHGGQSAPAQELAQFYIGPLTQ